MPDLKIIGCGDAFGSGGLMNTCYFVETKETKFLIDCGATSMPALKRYKVRITELDFIFISHLHGDHYAGLPFLLLELAIQDHQRKITIVSPEGCRENVRKLLHLLYPGTPVLEKLNIQFKVYKAFQEIKLKGLKFTAIPVVHSKDSLPHGMRIEADGKLIAFSGDTEWTENLVKISAGADLFLCECNFYHTRIPGHLDYHTLSKNVHKLQYKKILLTHLGDELLENKNRVEFEMAEEGVKYMV